MKLISLDSSGLTASVAVTEDDNLIAEYNVQYKKTHSQTLLPMLDELKRMTELDLKTVDAVAIAKGPGSFTGLRIGSAAAKGLAQALSVPVIEISTLKGLACNLYGTDELICPLMDARRSEVYTGLFEYARFEDGYFKLNTIIDDCALGIDELIEKLDAHMLNEEADKERGIVFLGDGVPVFKDRLNERLRAKHSYAPPHMNRQRAAAFAYLAMEYYREGRYVSAAEHAPVYLRLSQAERERNEGIIRKGSAASV